MKNWKYKIVPILFVVGGMGWLIAALKQLINGEPIRGVYITTAALCFLLASAVFRAARRKLESNRQSEIQETLRSKAAAEELLNVEKKVSLSDPRAISPAVRNRTA
jgi:hypothetical protein